MSTLKKINEYSKISREEVVDNVKFWALYATWFYEKLFKKIQNPEVVKSVYRNLMLSHDLTNEDKQALTFFYRLRRNEIDDPKFWDKIQGRELKENYIMKNLNKLKKSKTNMLLDPTYESFPSKAKFVKEFLNEKFGFYPKGFDTYVGIYSDTIQNLDDSILDQFEKYEEEGRIKGRIAPTNDYLIFYHNGDKEIEDFLSPYKVEEVQESLNEFNNAFGPMAASSNYERGGDPDHNALVDRVGEIEDYIFQNGNRVDAQEWDNLVENFLYGQPGEYDPEEIEEERYFNDLTNEELEELIGRGEFLINNIKKY